MRKMKDGNVHMEFGPEAKAKGYTMRANINPEAIRALKRWNRNSGEIIRRAMRRGDCKKVIAEMQNAKWRNREIRELAERHDKIVYDAAGKAIFWWDHAKKKMYELIDE